MANKTQLTDAAVIRAIKISPSDWRGRVQAGTWAIRLRLEDMKPQLIFTANAIRKHLRDMERRGLVTSVNEDGNNIIWTLVKGGCDD